MRVTSGLLRLFETTRRGETVRTIPTEVVPVSPRRVRDIDTGLEAGQRPGPVGELAQPEISRQIEGATAGRPVAAADIDEDVAVQHGGRLGRRNTRGLVVINP